MQFITVLPHEPLPIAATNNRRGPLYGYVHLQGSFLPKRKLEVKNNNGDANNSCSCNTVATNVGNSSQPPCQCTDIQYIETKLQTFFTQYLLTKNCWGIHSSNLIAIEAIVPLQNNTTNENNDDGEGIELVVSKVRLTLSTPAIARAITSRLRHGLYSPRDLLSSSISITTPCGNSNRDDNGCSSKEEKMICELVLQNDGLCTFGCDGRYAGKALMVTQITPSPTTTIIANENEKMVHHEKNETVHPEKNDAKASKVHQQQEEEGIINSTRWARAAPPKFRKLQLTTSSVSTPTANNNESASNNGLHKRKKKSKVPILTEEELEIRRGQTRFINLENILVGDMLRLEDISITDDCNVDRDRKLKQCLLSTFQYNKHRSSTGKGGKSSSGKVTHHDVRSIKSMMEDDICHAFQEALRHALVRDGIVSSSIATATTESVPKQQQQQRQYHGVELFLKTDTTSGIQVLYDQLHIGLRSNIDASKLIDYWQGRRVILSLELPSSFIQWSLGDGDNINDNISSMTINITTGKLFVDYADILLPNRPKYRSKDEATSSALHDGQQRVLGENGEGPECTSQTSHVQIPGLHVIPNFVNEHEEQILMALLTGPHAPWAPPQMTSNQLGYIKRRVQHYGYVFDYESSDVLRRNSNDLGSNVEDKRGYNRSACPPLPTMHTDRQSVVDMSNEEVEEYIARAVNDVNGWEVLAGVIERTRRYGFSSSIHDAKEQAANGKSLSGEMSSMALDRKAECSVKDDGTEDVHAPPVSTSTLTVSNTTQRYLHLNQLTLNEYTPGQGIGSHVDTLTAFDDGLLSLTLNGGAVMEFRQVEQDGGDLPKRKLVYLPPRSLLLLSKDARYTWEHMIVSRKTDTVDGVVIPRKLRVSLTFRTAITAPQVGCDAVPLSIYESNAFPLRWGQLSDVDTAASLDQSNASTSSTARSDLITPSTESKHVHEVYDAIATQWHHTRGKRGVLWPGATNFLEKIPKGSVVADVGCGDGKYFSAIWEYGSYVIGTDIR